MIVVDEHPAVSASDLTPGPFKKFRAMQMWMPILKHEDGYGFTYGARLAFKDSLGERSRVSVPMTWGGERRIGLEAERSFDGPISIVRGGVSLYRRVNPFFEVPDRRTEARVEADASSRRGCARASMRAWRTSSSGPTTRHGTAPRASTPWSTRGSIRRSRATRSTRASGGSGCTFGGVAGPLVHRRARIHRPAWRLAGAGAAGAADQGGQQPAVRGAEPAWRQRHRARLSNRPPRRRQPVCDVGRTAIPLNSPLTFGRFGFKAFVDAGTVWNTGARYDDEKFDRGIGGGIYLGAGPFIIDLDIAKPRIGNVRAHFGMGVTF